VSKLRNGTIIVHSMLSGDVSSVRIDSRWPSVNAIIKTKKCIARTSSP